MPACPGCFTWYELMTTDPDAAGRFYAAVVGWTPGAAGGTGFDYRTFSSAGTPVAGLMELPDAAAEGGIRPGWFGYLAVDDVDATIAGVAAAGGAVCMPPKDVPGVGRLAMLADAQDARFYVMRGAGQPSASFDPAREGHCAWNELAAGDLAGAIAFYTDRFGWTCAELTSSADTPEEYAFIHHAGHRIGAMTRHRQPGQPATWRFYFRVPDLDAAARRATAAGGTIRHGPSEGPGGEHILIASDPQGALFSLVGRSSGSAA